MGLKSVIVDNSSTDQQRAITQKFLEVFAEYEKKYHQADDLKLSRAEVLQNFDRDLDKIKQAFEYDFNKSPIAFFGKKVNPKLSGERAKFSVS